MTRAHAGCLRSSSRKPEVLMLCHRHWRVCVHSPDHGCVSSHLYGCHQYPWQVLLYLCVPIPNVSILYLVVKIAKKTDEDSVNAAAECPLNGVLAYNEGPWSRQSESVLWPCVSNVWRHQIRLLFVVPRQ